MIKCANPECNNYKQELEGDVEVCPMCGKEVEKIQTSLDYRRPAGIAISLISLAGLLLSFFQSMVAFYVGVGVMVLCIVGGIIVRMKAPIIVSILSVSALAGLMFYYGAISC